METTTEILKNAQKRAHEMGLTYKGVLFPTEAYRILQEFQSQLVDVRSRAELDWVGRIPGATEIELCTYPDMQPNPKFLDQLTQQLNKELPVFFICRSGVRSSQAAEMAESANFKECYNILQGFEGDKDEYGHRGKLSGWKASGLPWVQS